MRAQWLGDVLKRSRTGQAQLGYRAGQLFTFTAASEKNLGRHRVSASVPWSNGPTASGVEMLKGISAPGASVLVPYLIGGILRIAPQNTWWSVMLALKLLIRSALLATQTSSCWTVLAFCVSIASLTFFLV